MAITVKGIRIDSVSIERAADGRDGINAAHYSLISSTDHVLAQQSIGGYGSMTLKASPETMKALEVFMQSYKTDVLKVLGLDLD